MPRDTLTRERIVTAAIELLDAEGLEGLNMRALGGRLGSAATAVYWHVGSKANLIVLAADQAWEEIALPDLLAIGTDEQALRLEVLIKPEIRAGADTEMPPDLPPAELDLLPGDTDEYILTSGGLTGRRGYFTATPTAQSSEWTSPVGRYAQCNPATCNRSDRPSAAFCFTVSQRHPNERQSSQP